MTTKTKTTKPAPKAASSKGAHPIVVEFATAMSKIPQAMSPEAVSAVTKSRAKAVKGAKAAVTAKLAAKSSDAPKAEKKPRAPKPLAPEVVALIALLKTKKGATNEEAAEQLKLKSKGKAAHQSPSAQVRAMIRDKVRKLHTVESEHDPERSGIVFRIKS